MIDKYFFLKKRLRKIWIIQNKVLFLQVKINNEITRDGEVGYLISLISWERKFESCSRNELKNSALVQRLERLPVTQEIMSPSLICNALSPFSSAGQSI